MNVDDDLRRRLLGASPSELRRLEVEHPDAGPLIRRLLSANHEIRDWLEHDGPILREGTLSRAQLRPPRRTPSRAWTLAAAAFAAVAAAAYLTLGPPVGGRAPTTFAGSPLPPDPALALDVESPSDFVVFPTENPDIAVVWLLNGDE